MVTAEEVNNTRNVKELSFLLFKVLSYKGLCISKHRTSSSSLV